MTELELYVRIDNILWNYGAGEIIQGEALDMIMALIAEYTLNITENGKQED
jgi:hypothetical protein